MNWRIKFIFIGTLIIISLIILVQYFFPSFIDFKTILGVIIGAFLTISSTLAIEDYKSTMNKEELLSSVRSMMDYNLQSAFYLIEVLKNEIKNIETDDYNFEDLEVPLFTMKTELGDLIKKSNSKEILGESYDKVLKVAVYSDEIDNQLKVRENLIIFKYEDSILQIKRIDEKIITSIEFLKELIRN